MAIQREEGAKIVRSELLTPIRVISFVADKHLKSLKDQVKQAMIDEDASYAEDDAVIAALRRGSMIGPVDPRKLYQLVKSKKMSMEQFLDCVEVRKAPLAEILGGEQIDSMCRKTRNPSPSLVTEFKQQISLNNEKAIAAAVGLMVGAMMLSSEAVMPMGG